MFARAEGLPHDTVIALARRAAPDVTDVEQALRAIGNAIDLALQVRAEGAQGSNLGVFVDKVLQRLAELTDAAKLDEAAAEADRAFAEWEQAEAERAAEAQAMGLRLLEAGVRQDLLRGEAGAAAAAAKIAKRVEMETPDGAKRFEALLALEDDWYVSGRDRGLNVELAVSAELARIAHAQAVGADQRRAALNSLAVSLTTLGMNEAGPTRLEAAIVAYRAALEETEHDRVSRERAMILSNLAAAVHTLAEREPGTARLEESVEAFRAALAVLERDRAPLDWALAQSNLGNALRALGARKEDTELLDEAVAACRAALEERTRDRVPNDWATTQSNLGSTFYAYGTALSASGEHADAVSKFHEAVTAYNAALQEAGRERVPLKWAMIQNNLATAFRAIGRIAREPERLEAAIAGYAAALSELTRERLPLYWAQAFGDQGLALMNLAELTMDGPAAAQAASQIATAADVLRDGSHAVSADELENHLPAARALAARLAAR